MTTVAQGDQVFGNVVAQRISPVDVVNLEMLWASAGLTPPAIALEHLSVKVSVGMWI